jgi:hypothetical protein
MIGSRSNQTFISGVATTAKASSSRNKSNLVFTSVKKRLGQQPYSPGIPVPLPFFGFSGSNNDEHKRPNANHWH